MRPPGTQTSAGAGGNKIATWRMWTPRLPGLGTVKERLALASCWRSPCLMRENFATPSADASSDAAVGFGAALCLPLGGILLKGEPLGALGHCVVLGKCRFSNSNQLFQRFHRNSVKTRTLSPAASSNSNSNERELGKLEAPKPHKSSRVRVNSITSSSSTRSRLRPCSTLLYFLRAT